MDLRQHLFKMSSCAIYLFGYHCQNFVLTSCKHTYHPTCIMLLVSKVGFAPRCVACDELFHPNWLASWGLASVSTKLDECALELDLEK